MRTININGSWQYYQDCDGYISKNRAGHSPVSEANFLIDYAAALNQLVLLRGALRDMGEQYREQLHGRIGE
jgi:hypothetical protein